MIQFLEWVSSRDRSYDETMAAWRTSCPRLSIWEDAMIDGLIQVENVDSSQQALVRLTPRGLACLERDHTQQAAPTFNAKES